MSSASWAFTAPRPQPLPHELMPQLRVYANFSTKQELFLACVERAASEVQARAGVGVPATMQRGPASCDGSS